MKRIISTLILTGVASSASAIGLKVDIQSGYDTNPFQLSDDLNNNEAKFVKLGARFKQPLLNKNLYLKGNLNSKAFESSTDNANETRGQLVVGHLNSFKLAKQRFNYRLEADYGLRDKTYISKLTGKVGSFSNQSLEDRYDYQQTGIKGKLSTKVFTKTKSGLTLEYQQRDYKNYSIAGLSNLDFSSLQLANNWKYKINKRSNLGAQLSYTRRNYDNRLAKDQAGADISGTDLAYDYYGMTLDYKFHPARYTDVKLSYDFDYRKDNGGGYYNSRSHVAQVDTDYRLYKWAYLSSKLAYKNTDYLKQPDAADVAKDEELTSKNGYSFELSYRHSLRKLTGYKLYAGASLQLDDIGSDNKFYAYDRQRVVFNLKGEF